MTGNFMNANAVCALVVAGSSEPSSPELVASLAKTCDLVVAVDGGANVCLAARVAPTLYVGDGDSIDDDARAWLSTLSCPCELHPRAKDDTDLMLALKRACDLASEQGKRVELVLTCASGGRPDHALGVYGALKAYAAHAPRLIEDAFECRILSPEGKNQWVLDAEVRDRTLSVVPLATPSIISECGLAWNLDHAETTALAPMGISNVVTTDHGCVTCHKGVLAVYVLN